MSKGKYGAPMNSIVRLKKPNKIPCDCERCYHSERRNGSILHCMYYNLYPPQKTTCARYWSTKSVPKSRKKKSKKSKEFNIRRITMKELTKEMIIKGISDKVIYDIDYDFAVRAAENIKFTRCHEYSTYHYKTILAIIKSKLATISDNDEKLAYINCLSVNYSSLSRTGDLKEIIAILSGGSALSFFTNVPNGAISKIIIIILPIVLLFVEIYISTTRKWSFYDKIFEHLKSNIE